MGRAFRWGSVAVVMLAIGLWTMACSDNAGGEIVDDPTDTRADAGGDTTTGPQDTVDDTVPDQVDTMVADTVADAGCTDSSQCPSGVCDVASGACQAPTCDDLVQNGGESDTDCGGACPACAAGDRCTGNQDCASGVCAGGVCASGATCTDQTRNGDESDVDCGGACPPCADNAVCAVPEDCLSDHCDAGTCVAASCDDTILNGYESAVDCGGFCPTTCADGSACNNANDCASGVCDGVAGTCSVPTCGDGVENGDETDSDCGGATCSGCAVGLGCALTADCAFGLCDPTSHICVAEQCADGVKNVDETDVDCGGPSCAPCGVDRACGDDGDCDATAYLWCDNASCRHVSGCTDLLTRFNETTDGVYTVDPDGAGGAASFSALCDLTTEGGGWTMLLKATGGCAFPYDNAVWTTANVVNETDLTPSPGDAKFPAFNGEALTQLRAEWPDLSHTMRATWTAPMTALDRFQTFDDLGDVTAERYAAWPVEPGYAQYGFNLTCSASGSVRWGWMSNNEVTCDSNDAGNGIGMLCAGGDHNTDMGGWTTCCASQPVGNYPSQVILYGRALDPCADGVQNGSETGVDCGGTCAADCGVGQGCVDMNDCTTKFCDATTNTCEALADCYELLTISDQTADGVYIIDPDGPGGVAPHAAMCDMTTEAGGWTLLMKARGDCRFPYDDAAWTSTNTVNEADATLADTNAKYHAFNSASLTELRAQWPALSHTMRATWAGAMTALDRFQTFDDLGDVTAERYASWPVEPGYAQYGFDLTCSASGSVRWGWMSNNEATCDSNDAGNGIGMLCAGGNHNTDMGGWSTCCASQPIGNYPSRMLLWGRAGDPCVDGAQNGLETDVDCGGLCAANCAPGRGCVSNDDCTSGYCDVTNNTCEAQTSCAELLNKGVNVDGVYVIDPDSTGGNAPFEAFCVQSQQGGGWTMLMKATGDCTFSYDDPAWTTANLVNQGDLNLVASNAKLQAFNELPIREIWGQWPTLSHTMRASWASSMTALNRFQTFEDLGAVATQRYASWPIEPGYAQYGFDLTCSAQASVRWGWMSNNEATCDSNDAGNGIGMLCAGGNHNTDMGGWSTCCASQPIGNYPSPVIIFGR